jgi:pyruvate formate lyase activating enzyme
MTSGLIFHIQRFSIHDGPGIRTTVFLKGCAMGCFWCHNPEGRHPFREVLYAADRCIACGECVRVCPTQAHEMREGSHVFLRDRCRTSGHCVDVCCSGALEMNGILMSPEDVVREVLADRRFYENSGGGVTLSGGEPGLHTEFARSILDGCKAAGIHTAIETCGYCSWSALETLLPATDLVMMDVKVMTPESHAEATGNSNDRILANARLLALTGKPLIFRTPVVPTVNDSTEEFRKIVAFIRSLIDLRNTNGCPPGATVSYELLAFHKLASDKYANLGMDYRAAHLHPPSREQMQTLLHIAASAGVDARIR